MPFLRLESLDVSSVLRELWRSGSGSGTSSELGIGCIFWMERLNYGVASEANSAVCQPVYVASDMEKQAISVFVGLLSQCLIYLCE